jgi:endonuclease YncB( thermonuclease family)
LNIIVFYFQNKYLSAEIIKNGMGWHYKKHSRSKELSLLEQNARASRIGLWEQPNTTAPWDWRKMKKRNKN